MLNHLFSSQLKISSIFKHNVIRKIQLILRLSSTNNRSMPLDATKFPEWEPVYFFRHIKIASAVSNLKLLQFGTTTFGIPLCYTLENMDQVPPSSTAIFSAIGISGSITLIIFSKVTSGLIGFLYTNRTLDRVKISYIDFWGKRQNYETDLSDIKPFSEIQTSKYNIYMPLQFYSNQNRFKLLHTFGEVYDFDKFDKVFGG